MVEPLGAQLIHPSVTDELTRYTHPVTDPSRNTVNKCALQVAGSHALITCK